MTKVEDKNNITCSKWIYFALLYVPKYSPLLSSVFCRNELKRPPKSKTKDEVKAESLSDLVGKCYRMENYCVYFQVMWDYPIYYRWWVKWFKGSFREVFFLSCIWRKQVRKGPLCSWQTMSAQEQKPKQSTRYLGHWLTWPFLHFCPQSEFGIYRTSGLGWEFYVTWHSPGEPSYTLKIQAYSLDKHLSCTHYVPSTFGRWYEYKHKYPSSP